MPDHLSIITAQIAGFFVTSVLYSLYLYTFFQCLYALVRSRSRWKEYSDIHWGLVAITLILFANGTFNISLGLLRLIQQFALHMGSVVWVNTAKVVRFRAFVSVTQCLPHSTQFSTVNLQTIIGEGVMVSSLA